MSENQDLQLEQDVSVLEAVTIRLGWVSRRRLEQELSAYNLTVPQFIALRCIQESGSGCSMSELAESSYQVSATMTGIVDRLAEGGLVRRERVSRDRRTLRVVLTPPGVDLLQRISLAKRSWICQFLSDLTPQERLGMIGMAERYLALMEKTVKELC